MTKYSRPTWRQKPSMNANPLAPSAFRALRVLVLLCILGLGSPLVLGQSVNGVDTLGFTYALGSTAMGTITGNLSAAAYYAPEGRPGDLEFVSDGGTWTHFVTEFNYTVLQPQDDEKKQIQEVTRRQWNTTQRLPPGRGMIEWPVAGVVRVYAAPGPLDPQRSTFNVQFHANEVRTDSLVKSDPYAYIVKHGNDPAEDATGLNVYTHFGATRGWGAYVHLANATARIHGDVTLFLQHATVTVGDDWDASTPQSWERVYESPPNEVAQVVTARYHHAFLTLENARFEAKQPDAPYFSQAVHARVVGTFSANQARGQWSHAGEAVAFRDQRLDIEGAFWWHEAPTTYDASQEAVANADLDGRFRRVLVDHDAVYAAPTLGGFAVGGVAWWTAATATILGVGYTLAKKAWWPLFTRFTPKQLNSHPKRQDLLQTIRKHPGLGIRALAARLGYTEYSTRHHLKLLEDHKRVVSRRVHHERLYWLKGAQPTNVAALAQSHDAALRLVQRAATPNGIPINRAVALLRKSLGLSRSGAYKALERAQRHGIVKRRTKDSKELIPCS